MFIEEERTDTKSATNFLIGMKHNIKALGDLPVNKITRPMVNKMMDILKQEFKNSNAVINQKDGLPESRTSRDGGRRIH